MPTFWLKSAKMFCALFGPSSCTVLPSPQARSTVAEPPIGSPLRSTFASTDCWSTTAFTVAPV
jgi:hypothetical protein